MQISYNTLGVEIGVSCPSTVEEYDSKGGPGSCLKSAVDNAVFRGHLNKVRAKALEKAESQWEKRRVIGKDGENDVYEKDSVYFKRLQTTNPSLHVSIVTEANEEVGPLDLAPQRAGTPAKDLMEAAETIRTAIVDGRAGGDGQPVTTDSVITKLTTLNPGIVIVVDEDGLPNQESLARAIRTNQQRIAREATAALI